MGNRQTVPDQPPCLVVDAHVGDESLRHRMDVLRTRWLPHTISSMGQSACRGVLPVVYRSRVSAWQVTINSGRHLRTARTLHSPAARPVPEEIANLPPLRDHLLDQCLLHSSNLEQPLHQC